MRMVPMNQAAAYLEERALRSGMSWVVTLALVSPSSTLLQTVLMQGPVACTQAPVKLFGTLATVATTRMQYLIQLLMEPRTRNAVIVRGTGERVRVEATQGVEGLATLVIIALRPIRI